MPDTRALDLLMKSSLENLGSTARSMQVEVPAQRFAKEVEKRLRKLSRNVRIKGFRPGKVPTSVVRQRYLQEVYAESMEQVVQETLTEALRETQVRPVVDPKVTVEEFGEDKPMRYRAKFDVFPELSEEQVAALELTDPGETVTEDEARKAVEGVRKEHAKWSAVDRPAAEGDRVRLRYETGSSPAEVTDQSAEAEVDLVDSGAGEELRAALAGARTGDSGEVRLDSDEETPVLCAYRVEEVCAPQLPDWDDAEFLDKIGVGSQEELHEAARSHLQRRSAEERRAEMRRQIVQGLVDGASTVTVPESLREWCLTVRAQGMQMEPEAVSDGHPLHEEALRDAREITVYQGLRMLSGVEPDEEDRERVLAGYAQQFRDAASARSAAQRDERVRNHLEREAGWDALFRWVAGRARVRQADQVPASADTPAP